MYTFSENIEKKNKNIVWQSKVYTKKCLGTGKRHNFITLCYLCTLGTEWFYFYFFFLFHILMTKTGLLASSCSPLPYRESTLSESTKEECFICHYLGMVGKSPTWSVYATSVFTSVSRR